MPSARPAGPSSPPSLTRPSPHSSQAWALPLSLLTFSFPFYFRSSLFHLVPGLLQRTTVWSSLTSSCLHNLPHFTAAVHRHLCPPPHTHTSAQQCTSQEVLLVHTPIPTSSRFLFAHSLSACCVPHSVLGANLIDVEETQA